ncbi:GNAT family N-acetyltransferase [Ruegeria sp. 2205SS24-7]|uniref:GNAT family N-acetyltransferase n=1 Tax=Ruegeria discodermiae TaxID=3064389 RepID=UPI00274210F9|nr:GNAT family N-acetyltransferase [Ruegeria sp. 2205SS24-7]MDP5218310.1 GNAT family N-acetyltransferase [Ruegeria sp. 2205SS24-7]
MSFQLEVVENPAPCFALRHTVFVEEQGIPVDLEQDELDAVAVHLLAREGAHPIGAARVVFKDDLAKIGRLCVLAQARGTGLGAALVRHAVKVAQAQERITKVKLGAQVTAIGFYEKLGFSAVGPVYLDAGLDHRDMVMELP